MSPCLDLVSFADGELDPERAAAFRDHLRTCDACQTGLVEAMQLSAQLSTLTPDLEEAAQVDTRPVESALLPNRGHVEPAVSLWQRVRRWACGASSIPLWRRAWLWTAGVSVTAAAATVALWQVVTTAPAIAQLHVFADVKTRPYEIRIAYADAADHRPTREVSLGAGTAAGPGDRVSYASLGALEAHHEPYGLAIAQAWNGEKLPDVLKALSALPPTPSIQSDRAALELLTTSNDNAEDVLARLDSLRYGSDPAAARAARWNYAIMLSRLDLPLSAAQAFQAIAAEHEPGWSQEATARAAPLAKRGQDFEAIWQRAATAGKMLVDNGTPVPSELIQQRPSLVRAYFYNAVRGAPSRDRVLALAAMADELDRAGGAEQHTLRDYVQHVATLDFRRRAPFAAAYALVNTKPLTDQLQKQLITETASPDVTDIIMGAMVERDAVAAHGAWFQAAAERSGDPWFTVVLAKALAEADVARGNLPLAADRLRGADKLCNRALAYQCLALEYRLGTLYADLHRVHDSLTVLQAAVQAARRTGEWRRYKALLWRLADTERFHGATATVRACAGELLLMDTECANRGPTYHTLASAAILDVDGRAARRYLTQALRCEQPGLPAANDLSDIARLDPQPEDVAQVQGMLSAARASGKLTPAEGILADEIEGRLVVERDRDAGARMLHQAIAEADALPGQTVAEKARAGAYAVLAFDAGRARDYPRALGLVADDLGLASPPSCAVGMVAEDERAVVVTRGADGKDRGEYADNRRPTAGALTVSDALVQSLAGCPRVRVMAPAALQGQPRVLPAALAWSYATSARGRAVPPPVTPSAPRPLLVTNVTPPPYLQLDPLAPLASQPSTAGAATTLSGPEATPSRVLAAMTDATEIQFHTHALLDVGVSDASHLVLSPETDGRYSLTAEAIRTIALRGHPIIVLAACHSAQGARYQHAPWSLPDAFLAVGARAVFAAATEIPDAESSRFFASVLARVRAGSDPAVALRDQRVAEGEKSGWVGDVVLFE